MSDVRLYVWRHGVLGVDDGYDSVESAIGAAVSIVDYGSGSPHGVEAGDEWVTPGDDRWKAIQRAMWAEEADRMAEYPKPTHILEVMSPGGEWAQYTGVASLEHAKEMAEGFGKARIREAGPGPMRVVWTSA